MCFLCGYATRIYFIALIFLLQAIPHTIIIFVMYRALNCIYVPRDNLLLMFGYAAYFYHSKCVNLTTARFPPGYISPNDDTYFIFYKDWPTSTPKGQPLRYTFEIFPTSLSEDRLEELKNYFYRGKNISTVATSFSSFVPPRSIGSTKANKKVDTPRITTNTILLKTREALTTSVTKTKNKTFEKPTDITNISLKQTRAHTTEKITTLVKEEVTVTKSETIPNLTMFTENDLTLEDSKNAIDDKSDDEIILKDKRIRKSIGLSKNQNDFSIQKSKIKSKAMLEKYQEFPQNFKKVEFIEKNYSSSEEVNKINRDFSSTISYQKNVLTTQNLEKNFKPNSKKVNFIARPIAPYLITTLNNNMTDELLRVLFHSKSQLNPDFWEQEKVQWIMSLLDPITWIVYFLKIIWGEMKLDYFTKLLTQSPFFKWPELTFVEDNSTNMAKQKFELMHGWELFPGMIDTIAPKYDVQTGPTFPGLPGIPTDYPTGWENITRSTLSAQRAANLIYIGWPTKSASYEMVKTIVYSYLVLDLIWLVSILFLIVAALVRIRGPGTLFFYIPFIATTLAILILDMIAGIYFTLSIPNTWEFLDYLGFTGILNMDDVRNPIKIWFPNYGYIYAIPSWALSLFFIRGIVLWFFNWILLCKISHIFLQVTRQRNQRSCFNPILRKERSWTYLPQNKRSSLIPINCCTYSNSSQKLQGSSQMSGSTRSDCSKVLSHTSEPCRNKSSILKIYCKDPCLTSSEETYQ